MRSYPSSEFAKGQIVLFLLIDLGLRMFFQGPTTAHFSFHNFCCSSTVPHPPKNVTVIPVISCIFLQCVRLATSSMGQRVRCVLPIFTSPSLETKPVPSAPPTAGRTEPWDQQHSLIVVRSHLCNKLSFDGIGKENAKPWVSLFKYQQRS